MWTAPAADSTAPVPRSALGWCAPDPVLSRHSSASASRSPPLSHVVHCKGPGTVVPTGDRQMVTKERRKLKASQITYLIFLDKQSLPP